MKIVVAHAADETVDLPKGRRPTHKTDVQEVAYVLRAAATRCPASRSTAPPSACARSRS